MALRSRVHLLYITRLQAGEMKPATLDPGLHTFVERDHRVRDAQPGGGNCFVN